jgi:hypothetical protein
MSWGFGVARLLVFALGLTLAVVGLVMIASQGPALTITGVWLVGLGIVCMVATLIERVRYRSEADDRGGGSPGPGGGEPIGATIEPRFRRSDEVFIDPTSRRTMRVWVDPGNGERRYVAEE